MKERVLLRAASGPAVGIGHAMRTRAVAEEVYALGGRPLLIVDDAATAKTLAGDGLEVVTADERADWTTEPAAGAWLDGFCDWTAELRALAKRGTQTLLVENRSPARELCRWVVYPALHWSPDAWDERNRGRVLAGPGWIPLSREVRAARTRERDVDVLITFGGSDPGCLTERVLAALDLSAGRIVVTVGGYMAARHERIAALASDGWDTRTLPPGTPLARWIARSRTAITAVGTTLYELTYHGVPALVVANYAADKDVLDYYDAAGPHLPLGVGSELSEEGLRAALGAGLVRLADREVAPVPDLGPGATRLAERLLARAA